jgi:hypothetical protein
MSLAVGIERATTKLLSYVFGQLSSPVKFVGWRR